MTPGLLARWRAFATPVALAVVSVLAAFALWIAVTEAQNPSKEAFFNGAVEVKAVNVPDGLAVASIRDPSVTMKISAPENTLSKLTTADFAAEVDLSGERQPTSEKRVIGRVVSKRDVEIVEVTPAVVTVTLEPVSTRSVPVQASLQGTPPQGFSTGDIEINPPQARITGAESLVKLVNSVSADVNLTGLRTSIHQQYNLVPRDARGADVRGVISDPSNADLKVNILQQEVTLTLTILPSIQGSVADGFNLVGVTPDPPAIGVSGALNLLQALPAVSTESIDVSGLRTDSTRTVRLRVPAGLQPSRDSISVRLHVVPANGEITLAVPPQVVGVENGLRVTSVQVSTVIVRVAGELPTLRLLQPSAVKPLLNVGGMAEGAHSVPVTVAAPADGVQVVRVDPGQVVVTLDK